MQNHTHLHALYVRLENEQTYLSQARSERESKLRSVWIEQIRKEIDAELAFLGMTPCENELNDDELLAELMA